LITFAPAISQVLAATAQGPAFTAELCSAHGSTATPTQPSGHQTSDTLSHLDGQACGYCHFFAHAPVLPAVRASFALDAPMRHTVAPAPADHTRRSSLFITAQPRAPPVPI
jgi:hypothetical protein